MKPFILPLLLIACTALTCSNNRTQKQLGQFIDRHVSVLQPLSREANLAYWSAATTGKDEDYRKYADLDYRIKELYSNQADFKALKAIRDAGGLSDPLLARQADVLINAYLINQADPALLKEISALAAEAEKKFSTFRGRIDGREVTGNEIANILRTSKDQSLREKAWLASKQVGPVVAGDVLQLVRLRNQAARRLGYPDYHALSLQVKEQDPAAISALFDELFRLTEKPFHAVKSELDSILAHANGLSAEKLQHWHYHDPFFQESPQVYALDLDSYYKGHDVLAIATGFFSGIGLPVDPIISRSDLYERPGKNPHAFSTDIDREGDVRILCNLENSEREMETLLHELGHAVYDEDKDDSLPFLLRDPAHAFTTEGIANFFGRLSRNPEWMQSSLGLSGAETESIRQAATRYTRMRQLIFARWSIVMFAFEKSMYQDPDQDLNALWWNLAGKYQRIRKPEGRNQPDWAAKIHFVMSPCYYHNYLLGELFASQLHSRLAIALNQDPKRISYTGQTRVGEFLKKNIFEPGSVYPWNEMISRATGEELNPVYFVRQFIE